MNILGFVLLFLVVVALLLCVVMYIKLNQLITGKTALNEGLTKNIVNQVFGEISDKVATQAQRILEADKAAIFKDNQHKQHIFETTIIELKQEIAKRQEEIRQLEQDRNCKFGELTTAISEHRKITEELKTSTESLSKVLSNNQTRGQWGERIIEDILTNAGLIERIHYVRQQTLGTSSVKPDITLLLPNQRTVAVDVKFPYAEVHKMALAETKTAREEHLKAFARDLRDKIKQIETRGYIDIEHGTLDYAILFVPNEMLFSFINQQFPDIVDEAMTKKIMLVSPFTFLIVARTVFESYKNFMIENNLRKIVTHINQFMEEWHRFTNDFDKFDDYLIKMRDHFDKVKNTRYKQMDLRLRRIADDQKMATLGEANATEKH